MMNVQQSLPYPTGVSLGPPASPERQNSPPQVNLASNNPFRNRALSPANPTGIRPERPTSTNPFLDDSDATSPQSAPGGIMMSPIQPLQPVKPVQPIPQDVIGNTRDLFESLSIKPTPQSNGHRPAPPRPDDSFKHRSSASRHPKERPARHEKDPLDIFADPPSLSKSATTNVGRERERRPRRNSESSVMERPKIVDSEKERRRRERHRREREARHRDGKSSSRSKTSKKTAYHMDIIDKLDVTSIYGTGMFHHDGPFDACNPNRNRKGLRAAPMQAFPENSSNMALGGSGPVNKNIDLNLFHGTNPEGWNDFASTGTAPDAVGRSAEGVSFDPKSRIEPVHGSPSLGLGTSTFLDGAPASNSAMRHRTSENDQLAPGGGGLQRKKSLAQRIRGINRAPSGRLVSPEASHTGPAHPSNSNMPSVPERTTSPQDVWDRKGAKINTTEDPRPDDDAGRARSSSSPKQSTFSGERSSGFDDKPNGGGGGFLNRMKSLRKPQPKRRGSDE